MLRRLLAPLVVVLAVTACGGGAEERGRSTAPDRPPSPSTTATPSPTPDRPRPRPHRGVDASHHQGRIDWQRVAGDRIGFAYLKATEGSTYTDPTFVDHARAARRAGLRVGGYHYFSTCSPGAPQATHFAEVLAAAPARTMPPAIDLELLGNCADPPPRTDLLRELRVFLDEVEHRTRQRVVVYAYPDFEDRYRVRAALDRRLWVRRIGDTPPAGEWWLWQRDDQATIDGIDGPADLNVLAR